MSTKEGGIAESNRLRAVGLLRVVSGVEGTRTECDSAEARTVCDGNSTLGASANAVEIQQHHVMKFNNNFCNTAVPERAVMSEHDAVDVLTLCLCTRTVETAQSLAVELGTRMNVLHHVWSQMMRWGVRM